MTTIRLLAAALVLGMAVTGCSSKPQRSPLPKDRNAVDRISDAYVRAVELQNQGDCAKASRLLYRVAMQGVGYEDAQRRLGECTIATANGEQTRYMDGIVWLRRAAEAGWPEAQGSLAYEYATGLMIDYLVDPFRILTFNLAVDWTAYQAARYGMNVVDYRSRTIFALDDLEKNSVDYYAALRSAYTQNRADQIRQRREKTDTKSELERRDNLALVR